MVDAVIDKVREKILLNKARQGDAQSFTALVRLHEEKMIHVAYSFLGNMEDARDIAQEAFVKAYRYLSNFKGESKFSTWLYRILVNLCKDFLRKKKVRRHLMFFMPHRDEEDEAKDPMEYVAAKSPNAFEGMMNKELDHAIHEACDKLPFQQRSVFTLRYLEGMSLEEIAESLDLSVGAVKAHLWQAGQKMKKSLQGFLSNQEVKP